MRSFIVAGVLGLALSGVAISGQAPAAPWTLVPHEVATDLRGAYDVDVADINKDGRVDLLAVAGGTQQLMWFENPAWTRHVIAEKVQGLINAAAADSDKDGYPEISMVTGFSTVPAKGNGVVWLLTKGADVTAPWTAKEVDKSQSVHRIRWIDANGDGRRLIVNAPLAAATAAPPEYKGAFSVYAYNPADMSRQAITDAEDGVVHGITVVDWDGKGREALLTASFLGVHLHRYANGKWTRTRLLEGNKEPWPNNGAGDVAVLRNKGARMLAVMEPFHGNSAPYRNLDLAIYTGKGETWGNRTVIDNTLNYGHTLVSADFDGDGVDEVVAGSRGKPNGISVYRLGANNQWTKFVVEENAMAGSGCRAADVNNDTRIDLVCTGGSSLKWYENQPAK